MKRALYTLIVTAILLSFISCDLKPMDEGMTVNDYIYPYLEFTISEDESYYTVEVVEGTDLETVYIPSFADYRDSAVPIRYFDGFEKSEDAKSIKTIIFENSTTTVTDKAVKETEGLVNIKVDNPGESDVWGYLPPVEKEGKEFIGWFIEGTSEEVFEGDVITSPTIEPRFRDHTLVTRSGKAATCTSSGWEEYVTCLTCSYTTYREIPRLSHSLTHQSAAAATCTSAGVREYWSCRSCSGMFSDEEGVSKIDSVTIPALGHTTYRVGKTEAECGKEGRKEHWKCERCLSLFSDGEAENPVTQADLTIPALEHNFVRKEFSAERTCTWDECTLCHETTNPAGHSWDEGSVEREATETGKGTRKFTCTNGCSITKYEDIPPLDSTHIHSWIDGDKVEKTCIKRGYTIRQCQECHVSYNYNYDDALGHQTTLVEAKDATCTIDGNARYYECSVCSGLFWDTNAINSTTMDKITEGRKAKGQHEWSEGYEEDEDGHWHTCRSCGTSSDSAGHVYDRTDTASSHLKESATCTSGDVYYYSCECGRNGEETFVSGEALGHEKTHHEGQKADCIREGWHEYWTCSRCDKSFYDEECTDEITEAKKNVIPKTSHTDSGTYTTAGERGHQKYCSVCHDGYGDIISHTVQYFEWGGADSRYHWHICRYCTFQADRTEHSYTSYGSDEVCDVCLHSKEKESTASGGFDIKTGTEEPTGTLTVTGSGSGYHAVFTLDSNSSKTGIEWYLDDEKQPSVTDECSFTTPLRRTYTITCVLYNGKLGNSYSRKVYGGGTP